MRTSCKKLQKIFQSENCILSKKMKNSANEINDDYQSLIMQSDEYLQSQSSLSYECSSEEQQIPSSESEKLNARDINPSRNRCLLINDCPSSLMIMTSMLMSQNFKVDQATNGFQAFQMVQKSMQGDVSQRYILILVDLDISNSLESCQKIKILYQNSNKFVNYTSKQHFVRG